MFDVIMVFELHPACLHNIGRGFPYPLRDQSSCRVGRVETEGWALRGASDLESAQLCPRANVCRYFVVVVERERGLGFMLSS